MTTRRNMLLAVVAGLGAPPFKSRAETVMRPGTAFGTTVQITVTAGDEALANAAIDAAFAEIREVHRAASLFDVASEVSVINRRGVLEHPSCAFREIVEASNRLHRLSQGAFDPSIQPLWLLWAGGEPDQQAVNGALRNVGWHNLQMASHQMRLQPGAALSFNGIAQGYAADRVMHALRSRNVQAALIDTGEGGMLNAEGRIAIQHPRKPGPLGTIALRTGFVAVSGDYATAFSPDFLHHHIFDPQSGFSPRGLASVAVVAPSGTMADGLATAFMVMGETASLACLARIEGCSALFVDKAGAVSLSPGMQSLFQYA